MRLGYITYDHRQKGGNVYTVTDKLHVLLSDEVKPEPTDSDEESVGMEVSDQKKIATGKANEKAKDEKNEHRAKTYKKTAKKLLWRKQQLLKKITVC